MRLKEASYPKLITVTLTVNPRIRCMGDSTDELLMTAKRTKGVSVRDLAPMLPAILADLVTTPEGFRCFGTCIKRFQTHRALRLIVLR
mmetsp:Transcript_3991/g.4547  ORF Transcript_3991/g.4547 Transcript_3991/m.4547 type:complete len:88 (+) Transcript_3991:150-413(+)